MIHSVEVLSVLPAVFEPAAGDLGKLTRSSEAGGSKGIYFGGGCIVVVDDVPETAC